MTQKKKKKRKKTDPADLRGTDEPFLRLMGIGGTAVLKLLGIAPGKADEYAFRSVTLKERRLQPDVEGIPVLEGDGKRVYIEFQGYPDKFIRYRLIAKIMFACAQDKYEDRFFAGIVYTDQAYKEAALPVKAFDKETADRLQKSVAEIVLTDYTEARLTEIDPKLIVLAPFTVPPEEGKKEVVSRGRRWKQEVERIYPKRSVRDALNVMGLFIMNRFRNITREEVISVLNFDLMDTVAGRQVFEEGALEKAREMIIEALTVRFVAVPDDITETVYSVGRHEVLKELHRYAIQSPHMEEFRNILSKVSPVSVPKTEVH